MKRKIGNAELYFLMMILVGIGLFTFHNVAETLLERSAILLYSIDYIFKLLRFGMILLFFYLIWPHIKQHTGIKYYMYSAFLGFLYVTMISTIRIIHYDFYAYYTEHIALLTILTGIIVLVHLWSSAYIWLDSNLKLKLKIAFTIIILAQIIYYLSPFDGMINRNTLIYFPVLAYFADFFNYISLFYYYFISSLFYLFTSYYIIKKIDSEY